MGYDTSITIPCGQAIFLADMQLLHNRISTLTARISGIEARVGGVENRIGSLEDRIDAKYADFAGNIMEVKAQIKLAQEDISCLYESLGKFQASLDDHVKSLDKKIGDLNGRMDTLESVLTRRMDMLASQLDKFTSHADAEFRQMRTLLKQIGDDEGRKMNEALKEKTLGNEAYLKREFQTAHEHYDRAVELDPTNVTVLLNKAAAFFEQGLYNLCVEWCDKAIEVGRERYADWKLIARAYSRIGRAYLKQNRLEEAVRSFDKSIAQVRDPKIVRARQEVEKELDDREGRLTVATEEKTKGNKAYQDGDFQVAIKHYSNAIERNPDYVLYSNRAACYQKLLQFRLALEDSQKCTKLDPASVKGHIRKGLILLALLEPEGALKAFQEALRLAPDSADAMDGLRSAMAASAKAGDPEIQSILADPAMRLVLEHVAQDPAKIKEYLENPVFAEKIAKLRHAGVISTD